MKEKTNAEARYFGKPVTDDPDDAPELLEDFFSHGELRRGNKPVAAGRPPPTVKQSRKSKVHGKPAN